MSTLHLYNEDIETANHSHPHNLEGCFSVALTVVVGGDGSMDYKVGRCGAVRGFMACCGVCVWVQVQVQVTVVWV